MKDNITPEEFDQYLTGYDWFYYMSDDPGIYRRGYEKEQELLFFLQRAASRYKRIYNEHHARNFNTPTFVSRDRPYHVPYPEAL